MILSRNNLQGFLFARDDFMKFDTTAHRKDHLHYNSPLAGSFSWLLLGAGKPPYWRLSHFWSFSQ